VKPNNKGKSGMTGISVKAAINRIEGAAMLKLLITNNSNIVL